MSCHDCQSWVVRRREGDLAPCEQAVTPATEPLVGLARVRLRIDGGELRTHRDFGCVLYKQIGAWVVAARALEMHTSGP